jgi:hypothetical protein
MIVAGLIIKSSVISLIGDTYSNVKIQVRYPSGSGQNATDNPVSVGDIMIDANYNVWVITSIESAIGNDYTVSIKCDLLPEGYGPGDITPAVGTTNAGLIATPKSSKGLPLVPYTMLTTMATNIKAISYFVENDDKFSGTVSGGGDITTEILGSTDISSPGSDLIGCKSFNGNNDELDFSNPSLTDILDVLLPKIDDLLTNIESINTTTYVTHDNLANDGQNELIYEGYNANLTNTFSIPVDTSLKSTLDTICGRLAQLYPLESANIAALGNATSENISDTLVMRDSNGSFSANVVNCVATSAYWADYAEYYTSKDPNVEVGTLMCVCRDEHIRKCSFNYDIMICDEELCESVVGIVSDNPGFIINMKKDKNVPSEHYIPIALKGKVKAKVIGKVHKGDVLVSTYHGCLKVAESSIEKMFKIAVANETNLDTRVKLLEVII